MEKKHPLAKWLFEQEVSRADFADRIGVQANYLSALLSGARRPSLALTDRITRCTGGVVTAADFQRIA